MAESYNTNPLNVGSSHVKKRLCSLSKIFDKFHIDYKLFKFEKENFADLSSPFIAYLKNQTTGEDFVLVTSVTINDVEYIAENKKVKKISKEDFLKNCGEHYIQLYKG